MVEVNELPPRVLRWWGKVNPSSHLWALASAGRLVETVLDEELPRDMYPSQSWATVGMGKPWTQHGVFWYGDPKPSEHRFYWQRAADEGLSVGLVGVLHSSPIAEQCQSPNFRFVMPDAFSDEPATIPEDLRPLQELNLRLSRRSARVASPTFGRADLLATLDFARHGVRAQTWFELCRLAVAVGSKRWNPERLRVGQSLLLADVFEEQIRRHDPDLSVFFSNHVASAMHRYWAATFPEDWTTHPYGDEWIAKHEGELPFAMQAADRIIGQLHALAAASGRDLIVISSMGQRADLDVQAHATHQVVVREPHKLFEALGCPFHEIVVRSAMVPQISVELTSSDQADAFARWVTGTLPSAERSLMVAGAVVTFACELVGSAAGVEVVGVVRRPEEIGATVEAISDHRSGRHDPHGVLITTAEAAIDEQISALDISNHVLALLGIERP